MVSYGVYLWPDTERGLKYSEKVFMAMFVMEGSIGTILVASPDLIEKRSQLRENVIFLLFMTRSIGK